MPEVKRASTRSHSWQFLDRTPLHQLTHFDVIFTRYLSGGSFDFAQDDILRMSTYNKLFFLTNNHKKNFQTTLFLILKLRPPKLVNEKYTSRLQTVSKHYRGWRGVSTQRHRSDGAAGQAAYHRQYCSSRAEHQALAV